MVAFAPNGDVYIGQGHGNESPNDTGSDDLANNIGASRILHLDHNSRFINQWFGNEAGPGKFNSAHGIAVDPTNGDVWIGDREDYRIVVYSGDGTFLKTLQMGNLPCALYFDSHGQPWRGYAKLSWNLKRLQTLWFDDVARRASTHEREEPR